MYCAKFLKYEWCQSIHKIISELNPDRLKGSHNPSVHKYIIYFIIISLNLFKKGVANSIRLELDAVENLGEVAIFEIFYDMAFIDRCAKTVCNDRNPQYVGGKRSQ